MSIKTCFSIKDLESLSGIKAHTIRIWEKRYELLSPNRSDTNIRNYDSLALRKLLNVVLLVNNGEKISVVAKLTEDEIYQRVNELSSVDTKYDVEINTFKLSMMEFDVQLFEETYAELLNRLSVREVFVDVLVPFLHVIGMLWSTKTIKPVHEHFISSLIKQKLYHNISLVQNTPKINDKVYALFLPMNEIHELGILYVHYELLRKGYNSIYFGKSLPIEDLFEIQKIYKDSSFISFLTINQNGGVTGDYVSQISSQVLSKTNQKLHLLGRELDGFMDLKLYPNVIICEDLIQFVDKF